MSSVMNKTTAYEVKIADMYEELKELWVSMLKSILTDDVNETNIKVMKFSEINDVLDPRHYCDSITVQHFINLLEEKPFPIAKKKICSSLAQGKNIDAGYPINSNLNRMITDLLFNEKCNINEKS